MQKRSARGVRTETGGGSCERAEVADTGFGVPPLVSSRRGTNFGTYSAQTRRDSALSPCQPGMALPAAESG
jgi:hypothetical protein